jgi:chromosome partitioning protein
MIGHPRLLEEINTNFDRPRGDINPHVIDQLGMFLQHESIKEEYDVIVIDTGPSRNPIFRAALRASTHALIPFEPEVKSLQGINAMMQAVASENYSRSSNVKLELLGLVPNKVRHTNLHAEALAAVQALQAGKLCPPDVYLPVAVAFPERDVKGTRPQSVFHLRPKDLPARRQSEILGKFVFDRVFGAEAPQAAELSA